MPPGTVPHAPLLDKPRVIMTDFCHAYDATDRRRALPPGQGQGGGAEDELDQARRGGDPGMPGQTGTFTTPAPAAPPRLFRDRRLGTRVFESPGIRRGRRPRRRRPADALTH